MRTPLMSLLCLPCAGASATMYLRWRRLLPQWIQVVPVELPGRGSRLNEPFAHDFDALTDQLCEEHAQALQGPHALFGHSMGALLAYGMAQRQRRDGRPLPRALFVSGTSAPSQREPDRLAGKDDEASLVADLRKQGGTPEAVFANAELMRFTLDTLRADYRLCQGFRDVPGKPLPVPVRVFGGRHDDIETDRLQAWQRHAGSEFSLEWFDGGHFFIRQQEIQVLASIVRELVRPFTAGVPVHVADGRSEELRHDVV